MKNDWIIANINNPNFTAGDFKNIGGFNLENTELLPIEKYLKSEKIIQNPIFQNDSGQFSQEKFKDFYNTQATKFQTFQEDSSLDNYEYGFWDVFQKPTSRVRNPQFSIEKVANPTHQSYGVVGINTQGERTKSDFEIAETQKIFDWESGKFKEETPEDSALFYNPLKFISNLFSEPLVLAKYEEDTDEIDPLTGQLLHHKKGENKTNSEGNYYFETLGGRSLVGKNVLSVGDVLTKEDSSVNKYDFFDSDDLEKSTEGVIAKNLTAIAPMIFLGPVGSSIYAGFYVGREILKTLPMLEKIGTILSSEDRGENSMLNTLAAYGQKFTGGTSDYGKQHTFSLENFGNLISDVALQWGQQKFIADSIRKLSTSNKNMMQIAEAKALSQYEKQANNIINNAYKGELSIQQAQELAGISSLDDISKIISSGKWKESVVGSKSIEQALSTIRDSYTKKQKLGQDLSLVYMSLISNTDVYDSAIEHGATKQEAAAVALGSIVGMFGVDKYLGLGEMFFDDENAIQRRLYRKLLKDHYDQDVAPVISSLATKPEAETTKGILNFFKTGKEKTIDFLKNYHSDIKDRALGIVGKSIGEGLEEVSEELVTDLNKSLYELAGKFGYVSQTDIGAWDEVRDRYLMSFFGGAIGGGIFGGVEAIKNPKTESDINSRDTLLTIIRQEGSQNILKELDRMKNDGKLGSKELSINTQDIVGEDGSKQKIFLNADENNISQNDFNYNQMKSAIQQMDKIINGNQLNISDDKLFERMITSDLRLDSLKDYLKDASYISGYYQDFQKLVGDIYQNESAIEDLRNTSDPNKRTDTYEEDLQKLLQKREELNKRKEDFFKNRTQRYLKKTMFAINPSISGFFLPVTFEDYVQKEYRKPLRFLSENDKKEAREKYDNWVKTKKVQDLDEAFDSFEEMTKKILPVLQELGISDVEGWKLLQEKLAENLPNFDENIFYDTRIESKNVNIEQTLKDLKIIRSEEYDKPWRTDPSKSNKAFQLQLEENPSLYFEIVKDHEDGFWSIHFKTGNDKETHTDLTEEQKQRLFEAAATVIPEGDKLSTWGSLTRGGISGLNRFGRFRGFKKSGDRKVSLKAGQKQVQIEFDESAIPTLEEIKSEKTKEVQLPILRHKNGTNYPVRLVYSIDDEENINIDFFGNKKAFLISKSLIPSDSVIREEDSADPDFNFSNLEDYGTISSISRRNGEWYTEVTFTPKGDAAGEVTETFKGLLTPELVPEELRGDSESSLTLGTTYNAEEELTIPIWEKQTGETQEEYENRNVQLEGETPEEFEQRKNARKKLLIEQHTDFLIQSIQNLINSNTSIDSNTFRYIMSNIGYRIKDIKKAWVNYIGIRNSQIHDRIKETLSILNDDLSNIEDVWSQISSKVREYVEEQFSQTYEGLIRITQYDDLKSHENGLISFQDILNFIEEQTDGQIDLDDYNDDFNKTDAHSLVIDDLGESRQSLAAVDYVNINRALESNGTITLNNGYTITYTNGSGETININVNPNETLDASNPDNQLILAAIRADIASEYKPGEIIGYSEKEFNKIFERDLDQVKQDFDNIIGQLSRDPRYKTLVELQKKLLTKDNPTLKLLNAIASKLGENFGSIESTLQTIYEQYDSLAETSDFVLNDLQIEALEKAKMLLDFAAATIISASGEDSYGSPWAYNKTVNEWNREHHSEIDGEIEDLPEISQDLANVSLNSILQYQSEIDSWIKKARSNRVNKVKMFTEFDTHFENVKLKFFMDNKDKWITEDGVNLLEGVVEKQNPKDQVLEYERVLYKNVQELIKQGRNTSYLFDAFKDSINWQQAATQKTSKLDMNLTELSDYDKFIYIVSIIAQNPDNFYTNYKKFVEKNKSTIAPLSFQKHMIRILKAHENNKDLFNQFLNLFKTESGLSDLSILENTIISTGIGGSGKTSVGAKSVVNKNSWVCGPTETQINNLKELAPDLKGYSVKDLLKIILGDQYDKEIGIKQNLITLSDEKKDGGRADISRLNIGTFDNPPSNLILDEATLVSNAELQAIAKWCKLNNIQLVLIGDENQNGDNTPGNNIARETTIAVRTPKMQLSLRDGNIWKYQNQQTLMNLEDQLRDTNTSDETTAVKNRLINSDLGKFSLKYYFKDGTLTGDMIVDSITDEQINSLNGTVKFIGSESSPVYQKLKASGKNVERAYSLKEIQGQEADYVVCDINWSELSKFNGSAFKLLDFMRSLYTVITRSKKGSIIINNGLNSVIKGSSPQSYSTDSVIIDKEAIKNFSDTELNWLNGLTLTPDSEETVIQRGLDDNIVIEPILPEEEQDNDSINREEIRKDDEYIPSDISELPIQVYTNFNYLGINRNKDGVWYNESDSYRDIGIFVRPGIEVSEDKDKGNYADLLFDLKSFIVYNDIELYNENASEQLKQHFSKKNLENISYFVVKEKNNLQTHHLISEEQGLEELPEGEEIITLQARLKNREGRDCIITLGVLPLSTNLHEEISVSAIERKIQKLQSTPGNESEITKLQQIIDELNNGNAARNYQDSLDNISEEGLEIEKPDFTEICGLGRIRGKNKEGNTSYFKVRLSEIALTKDENGKTSISNKSRFGARTSNYIISPIYTSMDPNDPQAGKPCIFVTGRRIYSPTELANRYEEEIRDGRPATIRKIMLDPAGVSFESLFDSRYANTFTSKGSGNNSYTFPFDLLPVGVRMYTALHNFRANLRKFNEAVKTKFGTDLISLEKRLKEESRLFTLFKKSNSEDEDFIPNETTFRTWLQNNQDQISNDITFDQIQEIWKFNDEDLKDVKQFRLGYNERNGIYVRNISDGYLGNYINPQVAKQYLGTVEKIFEVVIDQIIPKNSINPNDLVDYRITEDMYKNLEKNWVEHIENSSQLLLNLVDSDEEGNTENVIPIIIEHKDKIKAIPLVLTQIAKYLQARQRMNDPDSLFEGYNIVSENSPYLVRIGDSPISYLKILEGGLGDIRRGRDIEPGVIDVEEGQSNSDRRLLNMFNIAFHGTIATGGNDFTKSVSQIHAKDVIFPYGIFVDPILAGKVDKTRKYRLISTNPKYYMTGVAPSGAKTFIKLKKKISTNKQELPDSRDEIEDEIKNSTTNILHQNLNNLVGEEIDITGTVTDNQELVDLANSKINSKLSEYYFSPSGRFSTPDDLLNLTISLTLNEDGTITENKLKDFEELKNKGNFVQVKKDGNNYTLISDTGKMFTISFVDCIKIHSDIPNANGIFSWSIKDALETYKDDFEFIDNRKIIEEAMKKKTSSYESPEAFKKAFETFLNQLKSKNSSAYEELMNIIIDVDELINKLLTSC